MNSPPMATLISHSPAETAALGEAWAEYVATLDKAAVILAKALEA